MVEKYDNTNEIYYRRRKRKKKKEKNRKNQKEEEEASEKYIQFQWRFLWISPILPSNGRQTTMRVTTTTTTATFEEIYCLSG